MSSTIYDQHRAAFAIVSAYCIILDGEHIASVAFKYPKDGAGRLWCYLHVFGQPMARGFVSGGGYDKHSAAAACAARKVKNYAESEITQYPKNAELRNLIVSALASDNGYGWDRRLRDAGFDVFQAV